VMTEDQPATPVEQDREPLVVLEPAEEPTVLLGEAAEPQIAASRTEPEIRPAQPAAEEAQAELARPSPMEAEPVAPYRETIAPPGQRTPAKTLIARPAVPRRRVTRNVLMAAAILVVVVAGTVAIVKATESNNPAPRIQATHTPPALSPTPTTSTLAVPQLAGLTVAQARLALVRAGLEPGAVLPANTGTPGLVVRSQPPVGSQVQPQSSITLFVGVSPNRSP
jgi:hypothetical protein